MSAASGIRRCSLVPSSETQQAAENTRNSLGLKGACARNVHGENFALHFPSGRTCRRLYPGLAIAILRFPIPLFRPHRTGADSNYLPSLRKPSLGCRLLDYRPNPIANCCLDRVWAYLAGPVPPLQSEGR